MTNSTYNKKRNQAWLKIFYQEKKASPREDKELGIVLIVFGLLSVIVILA